MVGYVKRYISRLDPETERYHKPDVRLINGLPAQALVRQVGIVKPALPVFGRVARTGVQVLPIGNTAESIVSQVKCSTLTVQLAGFKSPLMD